MCLIHKQTGACKSHTVSQVISDYLLIYCIKVMVHFTVSRLQPINFDIKQ